jgi:PKHD-type hydroxylase
MAHLVIENFLDNWSLEKVKQNLNTVSDYDWQDGRKTNTDNEQKINLKLFEKTTPFKNISGLVDSCVRENDTFRTFTTVQYLFGPQITKTATGGKYGKHLDVLFRPDPSNISKMLRSDLSFTLFLNDPEEYEGGNLIIDTIGTFKLPAGSMIIYPSNLIHEVTEVTSGERYVFIGWVQSLIKNELHRKLVFDYKNFLSNLSLKKSEELVSEKLLHDLMRVFVD